MPEAASPAPITMGLAVFHTERELERVLQGLWNRVERQIEAVVKVDAKLEQAKRRGQDPRGVGGHAGRAWRKAKRLFDEAVQAQEAVEQSTEALGWFDASGRLYGRERAQVQRDEASRKLHGASWNQAKRMLKDARTLRHVDRRHEPLRSAVPEPMLREALIHVESLSRLMRQTGGAEHVRLQEVVVLEQVLCGRLCADGREVF